MNCTSAGVVVDGAGVWRKLTNGVAVDGGRGVEELGNGTVTGERPGGRWG